MQSLNTLPDPLTQPDCDLRDFYFMPLEVVTLRDCDLSATATGDEFRAAVLLWCAAWHQVPSASIPDNDTVLSQLAGYGRVVSEWLKVRDVALKGWIKCNDGRFYHPKVAEKANEAIISKRSIMIQRESDRQRKALKAMHSNQPSLFPSSDSPETKPPSMFRQEFELPPYGERIISAGNNESSSGNNKYSPRRDQQGKASSVIDFPFDEKIGKNSPRGNNEFSAGNNKTIVSAGNNETSALKIKKSTGNAISSGLFPSENALIGEERRRENIKASTAMLPSLNTHSQNGFSDDASQNLKTDLQEKPEGEPPVSSGRKPGRKKKSNTTIPESFAISDAVMAWADDRHYGSLEAHFESFVLKCQSKSYVYADWDAAFKTAIRDDWAGIRKQRFNPKSSSVPVYEVNKDPSRVKYETGLL